MFGEDDLTLPVLSQLSFFSKDLIFEGRIYVVDKIQFSLLEQQEFRGFAIKKSDLNAIEIRQGFAGAVTFKIFVILLQYHGLSFFPGFEPERTGAAGMAAEISPVFSDHFPGYNGAVLHA